jgi:geranylgeranyl pyrophosphate synthase
MIHNILGAEEVNLSDDSNLALNGVKDLIVSAVKDSSLCSVVDKFEDILNGGKMLRARLVLRVGSVSDVDRDVLLAASAAVEMIHAASLLHDDVIDGGKLRRGEPALWVREGVQGAILFGDLLVCKAIGVLLGVGEGRLMTSFIKFTSEMCDAEVEQELVLRGGEMKWAQAVSTARRKTGSLFAFAGYAGAGADEDKRLALSESGYGIGTAYQLADDILDAFGDAETSNKTLGTDANRSKVTAAESWKLENIEPISYIDNLCVESRSRLDQWPELQDAWDKYFNNDIGPTIGRFVEKFSLEAVS